MKAPITGPKANAFHAAWAAARLAAKLITPGKTNADVVAGCNKFISAYGVNAVAGVSMHQLKRYVIDGNKCVVLRNYEENQRVEACTFEANEVYAIDVCVSTGEGKPRCGVSLFLSRYRSLYAFSQRRCRKNYCVQAQR